MKFQTGRLEVEMSITGKDSRVELAGQLDERADLGLVAEKVDGAVVFDLASVSFINSIGVREWIRLLRTLHEKNVRVALRRCSEAMVHQMNMIVETVQHARVESFYVPYMCDACGAEASMCIEVEPNLNGLRNMEAPPMRCPECNGKMSFSEIPARYLLFVSQGAGREAV
jgi:anti-anti-sigma regulatory factor